jgi:formylglycine-generating enzyme
MRIPGYALTRIGLALLLGFAAGCGSAPPRAQWLVFVGTDAPVPALGQQLLVELLDSGGTVQSPSSSRFLDASHPAAWPISFGIVPDPAQAAPRIRVRLYRLDQTGSDGLPVGASLLDATATLPSPSRVTRVGLSLRMACFGVASDPSAKRTCDPATGALALEPTLQPGVAPETLPTVGSWPDATTVPCGTAAPDGMTCLAGGAFLLGTQQFFPEGLATEPVPQHLVVLRPFALDTAEVTVGQVRSLVEAGTVPPPTMRDAAATGGVRAEECTYLGSGDGSNDAAPANCMPWTSAALVCEVMSKRLPTEAEWEYAARNLGEQTPYPWGNDSNVCDHAVVARGVGVFVDPTECEPTGGTVAPGPVAGGSALDTTALGILNLGGNVSEWTADFFAPYSASCWSGGDPLVDPSCQAPSNAHAVRGGSWQSDVNDASSTARQDPANDDASEAVGFRCALSM